MTRLRGWLAYGLAWLLAAVLWSLAAATSARLSPLQTLAYGLGTMSLAAGMGVGVWWVTGRIVWERNPVRFSGVHAALMTVYAVMYATWWVWLDLARGELTIVIAALWQSPVIVWNLLMGSWLYLIVAGVSYAVRGHRRAIDAAASAAEARLLAQQAQLSALRAQVNPHFLFNALHSVGALVSSDPVAADEALERLGELLRYTLANEDEVSLAREWRFTTSYLAFEKLRLGSRLRTELHLDSAAGDAPVPALVLQPLVENAVRHGIATRPEGGRVSVTASVSGPALVLRVEDDGQGVADGSRESLGFGLQAVKRRLRTRYGDRATVTAESAAGRGFSVTVTLPVESSVRAGMV